MAGMLVLASASPRRVEILRSAGIEFLHRPVEVPEQPFPGETAPEHVLRLARAKAEAAPLGEGEVVLGADTVVVVDGRILGKPADAAQARRMLSLLSGREHEVLTAICLRHRGGEVVDLESTRVRFAPLSERDIVDYVASGEPMDKAGAYAIQGLAGRFIDGIDGCYFNVVGLPIALVWRRLREIAAGGQIPAPG